MWGLILIQSHEKNTCMTASFHKERRFGLWNLPLFIEVPVPSQKSGKLHICARSVDLSPFRPTVLCFFIFHLSYVHIPDMTISTGFDINLYFTLFRWRGITLNEHTFGFYGHIDKYNVWNVTPRRCRGRDRMVVGFTTTYTICVYHHWFC